MSSDTINLTKALYQYLQQNSLREHQALRQLREETQKMQRGNMQISPEQGQLMQLLIELLNAKRTLDIGTFTGYSAIAVALALPSDGEVITCDIDTENTKIAKAYFAKANVEKKIKLKIGPASDTLQALLDQGEASRFDFAFIDADKANYEDYFEKSLRLIRRGGLIAIDNVLWDGKVANPTINDATTQMFRRLNAKLLKDNRVSISLIPIGDGLTLARKK